MLKSVGHFMSDRIYRFAEIEVDPAQGCVRRDGEERHLRQQTFQVLVYLLEQKDRIVTKDELLGRIWNGTAVTDDALVQCVMDIRRALGDDSRRPRFIKTVPKLGYRFIGEFDPVAEPAALNGKEVAAPTRAGSPVDTPPLDGFVVSEKKSRSENYPVWLRGRVALIILGVLVFGLAAGLYFRQRANAHKPSEITLTTAAGKKSVAVMFFDNQSGSTDLDWLREGLADMLITDLSRSGNLAVLSRQQLHVLLERIGHKESEPIRLDEALDLAKRSQAQVLIQGSFARLGEQIRIDVKLHDARDGQLLTAESLVVNQPEQILTQVDLLSLKLASHLGSRAEELANTKSSVMTNNLEAFRYYSLGVEKAQAKQSPEAIALLEKAIALDPEFAMAYARIGYTYVVSWGRTDEGKPYLEKAFKLTNRLSEHDKLNISAWYALANHDYPAAIKAFQDIVERYPLEVEAYERLGKLLRGEERLEEAVEILKQGLVIDSEAKEPYNLLGGIYSGMGRHDEAIAMYQRYVQLAPEEPNAHDSLGMGYQWSGRYGEAIQEYERALTIKPDFEISLAHVANTLFQQGRFREAIEKYQRYVQIAPSAMERSRGYTSLARVQLQKGSLIEAEQSARQATANLKLNADGQFLIAVAKGDLATTARTIEILKKFNVPDRGSRFTLRRLIYYQGRLDLLAGRSTEAIANLKEALKHRAPTWDIDPLEDCLANAYLELGQLDEAIAEYNRILKLNPNYPLVQYHLGQAYERKGQPDEARESFERFLQIWKEADADIPEVVAAKKALAVQT
jgi:tetratricopeptide (TPR) repeat protein/DNA-binding winged helix-turn-helix (wHTH) protein